MLRDAAGIYEQRNAIYKDNYKRFGAIFMQLMPGGVTLKDEDDFNRFSLFVQVVAKMTRYGQNFDFGGHADSLDDMAVYGMMLQEIDAEVMERNPLGFSVPQHESTENGSEHQAAREVPPASSAGQQVAEEAAASAASPAPYWTGSDEDLQALKQFFAEVFSESEPIGVPANWRLLRMANVADKSPVTERLLGHLKSEEVFGVIEEVMNDHGYIIISHKDDHPQSEWIYNTIGQAGGLFLGEPS